MGRVNLEGSELRNITFYGGNKYLPTLQTLGGTYTMDADEPQVLFLDPGGADRTVLLPAEASSKGLFFTIINTADADETLTVKEDSNTTTIGTIGRGGQNTFFCNGTTWYESQTVETLEAATAQNLLINTVSDDKTVRLNSRSFTQVSGSSIGFQSKPAQSVTSTGSVIGGEISPRVNDDIDIANVIGLHVDAYLKGTAAKTISGDVRGMQIELVTDDAATNTISGNVSALRIRAAFSASTLTGVMAPIRIEKAEAQTNSQNWDCVLELPSSAPGVWNADPTTELNLPGGTVKGYFKVLVGGAARYVALYEIGNLAD